MPIASYCHAQKKFLGSRPNLSPLSQSLQKQNPLARSGGFKMCKAIFREALRASSCHPRGTTNATHTHTLIDARTDSKAVPHASLSKPPKGSSKLKISRAQSKKRTSDRMTARRALALYS